MIDRIKELCSKLDLDWEEQINENVTFYDDARLDEMFSDYINDTHEMINIMGVKYCASFLLYETDPIHYQCEYLNWLDAECQDERFYEYEDNVYLSHDDLVDLIDTLEDELS